MEGKRNMDIGTGAHARCASAFRAYVTAPARLVQHCVQCMKLT